MSKNFELMQRIERERQVANGVANGAASRDFPPVIPLEEPVPDPILRARDPSSGLGELRRNELLNLVHRLFVTGSDFRLAVVFSAVEPDGGAAQIVGAASGLLAQNTAAKICVVDANVRAPRIHEQFELANKIGWSDALGDTRPARKFMRRVRENLWIMTAGAAHRNANGEFKFNLDAARPRITELRAWFDYVLIAVGNIGRDPEALLWATMTDGAVLVLEANATRRDSVEHSRQALRAAHVPLLGAVLNNREFPIPRAIYKLL